jgi:hypothetical protein
MKPPRVDFECLDATTDAEISHQRPIHDLSLAPLCCIAHSRQSAKAAGAGFDQSLSSPHGSSGP